VPLAEHNAVTLELRDKRRDHGEHEADQIHGNFFNLRRAK